VASSVLRNDTYVSLHLPQTQESINIESKQKESITLLVTIIKPVLFCFFLRYWSVKI